MNDARNYSFIEKRKASLNSDISSIEEKVVNRERLSFEDGLTLFQQKDLLKVGQLANLRREQLHKDVTYFNRNLHLNSTNVCEADCIFCSFARLRTGMSNAFTLSIEESLKWIEKRYQKQMTEIHIVNGLNPDIPFSYYEELLSSIKKSYPSLHIKAFTAVEIYYFSTKYSMSYEEVLTRLVNSGLQSLPGGGAEMFSERVRAKICRDKVDAKGWLEIHNIAHRLGLKSNCTMLYGTIETLEERVDHLIKLREQQDLSRGFQAFIPLAYHPENNRMGRIPAPTAFDDLRTIAVSRLMLDNIDHIKAYWVMLGVKTAQLAQLFGANDLDGTVTEEKVYHMAGAKTPDALTVDSLVALIKDIGRVPVERTTTYQTISSKAENNKDVDIFANF